MAKGKIIFDLENCKGCGNCVAICPKKIISLDTKDMNKWGYYPACITNEDMDKCIACKSCAIMCPDCIITVEKLEKEEIVNV